MSHRYLPCVLALAVLTACSGGAGNDVQVFGGSTDTINSHLTLHNGSVTVKAAGAPDALVDANGQLSINGQNVQETDAQRVLLQRYNASAQAMREHAIATGKAGVATATQAISAAAGKMIGSDSAEEAHAKTEAAADNVKQAAAKICDDLADMKAAQDQLATQMDAFKPYSTVLDDASITKCRHSSSKH
jgi:hypothetical protein